MKRKAILFSIAAIILGAALFSFATTEATRPCSCQAFTHCSSNAGQYTCQCDKCGKVWNYR